MTASSSSHSISSQAPRNIAPKEPQPPSQPVPRPLTRSSWPATGPTRPVRAFPTLPPLSQMALDGPRGSQSSEVARSRNNILPPLRTPIPKAMTSVQGVGYQELGWRSTDIQQRGRSE